MWLYLGKIRSTPAKIAVLGQSGCIPEKMVEVVPIGFIRTKWLCSGKVLLFGQKLLYSGKVCCIWDF